MTHSITSSCDSNAGRTVMPSAFAIFDIDHEGRLARLFDREIAGPGAK
jgi:hypothetical protein